MSSVASTFELVVLLVNLSFAIFLSITWKIIVILGPIVLFGFLATAAIMMEVLYYFLSIPRRTIFYISDGFSITSDGFYGSRNTEIGSEIGSASGDGGTWVPSNPSGKPMTYAAAARMQLSEGCRSGGGVESGELSGQ